jgi:hypothetical protein
VGMSYKHGDKLKQFLFSSTKFFLRIFAKKIFIFPRAFFMAFLPLFSHVIDTILDTQKKTNRSCIL